MYNKTYKQNEYKLELVNTYENESLYEAIIRTLEEVPFEKISVPLQAKRSFIDGSENEKLMQIGYIKSYNTFADKCEFSVAVFSKYADAFKKLYDSERLKIRAVYTKNREGYFKCITKLTIEIC